MCPESQKWCAFLDKCCYNDLSFFSVRYRLKCLRINNLNIYVIIPIMHTRIFITADSDTRSVNLRQTIDIIKRNSKLPFNVFAHLLTPTLGTKNTFLQIQLIADSSFIDFLRQKQCIRRCRSKDGRFQIHHHLNLLICITRSHRNCHCAKLLTACLESDSRRPQTITGCNLNMVFVCDACGFIASCKHNRPVIHILCCIRNDDRLTCRSGRRMDSYHLLIRYRLDPKWISIPKIRLAGERKLLELLLT